MKTILRALAAAAFAAVFFALGAPAHADPVYQSSTIACTHSSNWAANATPLATSITGKQIYVCGFDAIGGTAAGTAQVAYATTGGSCASPTAITPTINMAIGIGLVDHQSYYEGLTPVPSGSDLCGVVSGAGAGLIVYWAQF